jgi:Flp pilus assembly protein TadG
MGGLTWLRSLVRDVKGAIAIYIALIAPVLIGIGALTLDLGRLITLNTELQSAADAASLAGARELNRFPGAIDKARAAAVGAVANMQTFAADGGGKQVVIDSKPCADPPVAPCIRFLKELPTDDDDPITATNLTTSDNVARFIEVFIASREVTNFLIQVVGGPTTAATAANSVAGQNPVVCTVPPMFMCNPSEPPNNTDMELAVDMNALSGRQMEMFHQGGGGTLTPGNFGLLCPAGTESQTNCGAEAVKDALGSADGTCVGMERATTKTGVDLQMVRTGINVRFDYWTAQAKDNTNIAWRSQDIFAPAANVSQGGGPPNSVNGNAATCEYTDLPAAEATRVPRDQCHLDDNCGTVAGNINGNERIGNASWDYHEYYRINHGCNQSNNPSCKPSDWDSVTGSTPWPPTRYETYRYEVESNPASVVTPSKTIYDTGGTPVAQTAENGHVQCFQGTPPAIPGYGYFPVKLRDLTLLQDRRILPVAIANCNALEANGISTNGKFSFKIPEFVYVFLTEPMKNPSDSEIYAEILGTLDEGAMDTLVREVVQLYRR